MYKTATSFGIANALTGTQVVSVDSSNVVSTNSLMPAGLSVYVDTATVGANWANPWHGKTAVTYGPIGDFISYVASGMDSIPDGDLSKTNTIDQGWNIDVSGVYHIRAYGHSSTDAASEFYLTLLISYNGNTTRDVQRTSASEMDSLNEPCFCAVGWTGYLPAGAHIQILSETLGGALNDHQAQYSIALMQQCGDSDISANLAL